MTSTEPALWTKAPTTGSRILLMARAMAMKLSTMENVILHLIVVIIRFESATRWGSALIFLTRMCGGS